MNLEGVLLIDKPRGVSSFDVVRKIKKIAGLKRVGHAGTLDPLASGLLILCLGRYTKLSGYLMSEGSKVYETLIELGVSTSTDDAEGEILSRKPITHLLESAIEQACHKFVGTFIQVPPKYSAIKIAGQRAYEMARNSEVFEMAGREQTIYSLEILEISLPLIRLRIECNKGTYIRSLARDIGQELGVGAYAKEIRRLRSGLFSVENAASLDNLTAENVPRHILSGQQAFLGLPTVELNLEQRNHALHGRLFSIPLNAHFSIAIYENNPVAVLAKDGNNVRVLRGL